MSPIVMTNPPRLINGPDQDPAAMLLRSARSDVAPSGAKDRVRMMLGMNDGDALAVAVPVVPRRAVSTRKKRTRVIARFVPFQNVLIEAKPMPVRRFGAVAVSALQVAAIVAALFVRPFPRIEPVQQAAVARRDEPEVSFFVPKAKKQETTTAAASLPENGSKASRPRKEGFGPASSASRSAQASEPAQWNESIVGDEHAGMLSEPPASEPSLASEPPSLSPAMPMTFQPEMTKPLRIGGTDPIYPMSARMRGVSGTVVMRCVITEKGLTQNCKILKSPAYLDVAVLDAARTWRFTPITRQGRPVSANYVFQIKFKLG